MLRTPLLLLALVLTCLSATAGCGGGDGPESFLGHASNAAILVKWTRTDDELSGAINQARIDESDPFTVATEQISFAGRVNGSAVSLRISQGFGVETTLTGSLTSGTLTLDYPGENGDVTTVTFRRGTSSGYNQALADLRDRAGQAKADADQAQADADQASADAAADAEAYDDARVAAENVTSDIGALTQTANGAAADAKARYDDVLATLRTDLETAKADTATALADGSRRDDATCSDSGAVDGDEAAIEGDIASLDGEQLSTRSTTAAIRDAIARLRQDGSALSSFDARYLPADAPDQAAVDASIAEGRREAHDAAASFRSPRAESKQILRQALAYAKQASAACDALDH